MEDVLFIVGLMSGSSLDGLDLSCCQFSGNSPQNINWECLKSKQVPFPPDFKTRLKDAPGLSAINLFQLETDFSQFCAESIRIFVEKLPHEVNYLAVHGHTIFHYPDKGFTCQIANGALIAAKTGLPTVVDFRSNDIALGGQGAPIAPISEVFLYPGFDYYFNLGGIANFSRHKDGEVLSLDSCPCNQVLNHLMNQIDKEYDDKGLMARNGQVVPSLLMRCEQLPYFEKDSPKSMDNSWVRQHFFSLFDKDESSLQDKLATMVEFIAVQLQKDIRKLPLSGGEDFRGLITGGGAFNDFLVERIQYHLNDDGLKLIIPEPMTIEFKESILMAFMGYLRVKQLANTLPSVTGASCASIGGAIYLP